MKNNADLRLLTIFKLIIFAIILISLSLFHLLYDSQADITILYEIRLPRLILAISVGGGIGLSGTILQGIFRNNLVEPYTLGISGGAALGIAIGLSIKSLGIYLTVFYLPIFGFLGAILSLTIIYLIALNVDRINTNKILLVGIMISLLSSSGLMLILSISKTEELHSIIYWIMGSLDEFRNELIYINLVVSLIVLIISIFVSKWLNIIQLGSEKGFSLGLNLELIIKIVVSLASLMTAISVATAGIIPFIGIVAPHITRSFVGNDYRFLTIGSYLNGGIILVASDIIARSIISPNELPVGVITGLIGGIIFINIFRKSSK
ncbi:MAG: iron ABC transporter permease [Deferribacterales bacterium]